MSTTQSIEIKLLNRTLSFLRQNACVYMYNFCSVPTIEGGVGNGFWLLLIFKKLK